MYGARSYGYVTEVSYDAASGTTSARKWYSLGRSAVEMGLVMPDQKTVRGALRARVHGHAVVGVVRYTPGILEQCLYGLRPQVQRLPSP